MVFSVKRIRHLYNFKSHILNCNGHRYHYLDEGLGNPIVMLHGNPSWSFMYRDLVRTLSVSHRVIVPDHIGCGLSDKPSDRHYNYCLEQRVCDLEALLNRLGIKSNVTLVMHDWGGPIGMTYAVRNPSKIARLVVLNTTGFLVPPGKNLHWTLRVCRVSRLVNFLIQRFNLFSIAMTYLGCRMRSMSSEVRQAYTGPYDSWKNRVAIIRFIQDIPLAPEDNSYHTLHETQEKLEQFQGLPVIICWGGKDFIFDRDFLQTWMKIFPEAEVHHFLKAGHCILEDIPEKVTLLVRDFLIRHPLGNS